MMSALRIFMLEGPGSSTAELLVVAILLVGRWSARDRLGLVSPDADVAHHVSSSLKCPQNHAASDMVLPSSSVASSSSDIGLANR
jgi:hypothetical protein